MPAGLEQISGRADITAVFKKLLQFAVKSSFQVCFDVILCKETIHHAIWVAVSGKQ